jgi:uncharacterized membrane protein YkvA (DUF1232 family)
MAMAKKGKMKSLMREAIMFVPNLVRLMLALLRDRRVSSSDKAILAGTILYVIAPIDILPDIIPFIGQIDDSYLVALALLRLLNRADRTVVMDHWGGERDIKELVSGIARVAEYFLPKRLKNALRGRIERQGTVTALPAKSAVNE